MTRLRVTVELFDDDEAPVVAGVAEIERVGPPADVADYAYRLDLPNDRGGWRTWKRSTLRAFPRKRRGQRTNVWDLLYRVLRRDLHARNRGGEP